MPIFSTADERALDVATDALRAGEVVAIPTDTVYGVAVDPAQPGATGRLFAAKQRPRNVEVPVLVADEDQARQLVSEIPEYARQLMARYWPGALTLVLPRSPSVTADLGSNPATIGVRCPDHVVPRELCRRVGPLATTSANLHGQATLPTPEAIEAELGDHVRVVLDAGPCTGAPSTVVDCTGPAPKLLREGRIPWSEIGER